MNIDKIKVVYIDDHRLLRVGIKNLFENEYGFIKVVAEADEGLSGLDLGINCGYDVILTNIGMTGLDGIVMSKRIVEAKPNAKIIIFTAHSDKNEIVAALNAGVRAYTVKSIQTEYLIILLRYVKEGGHWIGPPFSGLDEPPMILWGSCNNAIKELNQYKDEIYSTKIKLCITEVLKILNKQSKCKNPEEFLKYQSEIIDFTNKHLSIYQEAIKKNILIGYSFKTISELLQIELPAIKAIALLLIQESK